MKWWQILILIILGFVSGYTFRSFYAFHHHPPYFTKVKATIYTNKKEFKEVR